MPDLNENTFLWQDALVNAITRPEELLEILELDKSFLPKMKAAHAQFPLKVPRGFVARMKKKDPNDPLLKQILPMDLELSEVDGFEKDPLKELAANPIPGLLHKYYGRVLLTLTGTCSINCRYCFRRHFPYEKNNPGSSGWEKAFEYIRNNSSISEIILSGGEPLINNDTVLKNISEKIAQIPHISRVRIHTRMPIAIPERVTNSFMSAVTHPQFKTILVTHVNHSQEIDDSVKKAMGILAKANIILLNQAVLLKGINDNIETLVQLSETLFDAGILPYYLHLLDKVKGAAHFDLAKARALELHHALTERLSGFLVPKLVFEEAKATSKIPLLSL